MDNPSVLSRFSEKTQGQIQNLVLKKEQEVHKTGARIIFCDRSVLDAVVYVRASGDFRGSEKLLDNVSFWLPTYRKLLLLDPADIVYSADSVRREDASQRQTFHEAFLSFFAEKKIDFEMLSGSLEERIEKINAIMPLDSGGALQSIEK